MSPLFLLLTWVLPIPLVIWSAKNACSLPPKEKVAIDLNLTGETPIGVRTRHSGMIVNGLYYHMKRAMASGYRLGNIKYGDQLILPEDVRDSERYVLFINPEGCKKYLRVVTKSIYRGKRERRIHEFIAEPTGDRFQRVVRTLVHIDLYTQGNTEIIEVEEDVKNMTKKYRIRSEMKLKYAIGAVRCGRQIINRKIQNIVDREVIWEGGAHKPEISIVTVDIEGDKGVERYEYTGDERGFLTLGVWYTPIYTTPSDESDGENVRIVTLGALLHGGPGNNVPRSPPLDLAHGSCPPPPATVNIPMCDNLAGSEERVAKAFRAVVNQPIPEAFANPYGSIPLSALQVPPPPDAHTGAFRPYVPQGH
ncbi:signal peptide-containing protein [Theileria equi strain WA]|uniref:Signal peptide-containing protein n=1 Tax=Theileria equi strain WA TaxID=1537102 RepID=L0AX35_THEEQ|nr:signal peptide-containing protein [Theileria equi strain WA]AFZ79586.1 signal peptide-containing protein [Theileria equi strain WA]|eukprot:XP_004829252.1 signal peptide-containing protein [Theileria equi strain WA]